MRLKNKVFLYELISIVWIVLAAIPRRLIFPLKGLFAFNYDQGRDFLAVSKIIWDKDLVLIGQTTGLPGIFYGPWWYYFLAPVFFISGGDPQSVAIFFAILAILSIVFLYLLLKTLTKNTFLSLILATIAAFSNLWMFGSPHIWNPSLTPIFFMISIFALHKIATGSNSFYFLIYGLCVFLAIDTTASFGAMFFIFFIISPFLFKKLLFKKQFLFAVLGAFIILFPRILFDLRNNFLITKSLVTYFANPKVYGDKLPVFERFVSRLEQMLRILAEGFTGGHVFLMILLIVFAVFVLMMVFTKNKKLFSAITRDQVLVYIVAVFLATIAFFTLFPDRVWGYYLVVLPTLFIIIIAKIFTYGYELKILKFPTLALLLALVVLNFRMDLLPPYQVKWLGDGATYINEKKVMDYITSQNPVNYSFFAYTPAIFDYPFDYLILWYSKRGLIETPQENQKIMYLVIREASSGKYHTSGWYGDKTRDKTEVVDKKEFPGDLKVEKHRRLD